MRSPTLAVALLGMLLAATPLALAQSETNETTTDEGQQAWVDDCPPDMMCAFGADESSDENATAPRDCGGEVCAYDESEKPAPSGECMDGSACRPEDCEYCRTLDGTDAPAQDETTQGPVSSHTDTQTQAEGNRSVPGASLVAALGVLGLAALAVNILPRRR